jgi:hypothetical protein
MAVRAAQLQISTVENPGGATRKKGGQAGLTVCYEQLPFLYKKLLDPANKVFHIVGKYFDPGRGVSVFLSFRLTNIHLYTTPKLFR